ncbi:Transcriptional regulatory protein RcsB [Sulfitobacter sp. DSM 110093]|uniref:helix-turn-helix transcriptional regulator n=1 Tax=Sulfitobacter sp. DSM 110093 TaxID=2883127 RepID=UPI001FAD8889|nr:LuxR family transcriptional regulator [Sulfitobacter sp. DSM 110093]UOA33403.1 Transcriptional regulatory protein RcsB [Sulfitobacter sp. DSM 110093]
MLVDVAVRLEKLQDIDTLWDGIVEALREIGFTHALHISVGADFKDAQLLCTIPDLYKNLPPEDDPFLHHSCNSYEVLMIGQAFVHLYPDVTPSEHSLIARAAREGLHAAFAVPMRLQGSERFGGFVIGNGMAAEEFEQTFHDIAEELRLFCLLMHRRIEDLVGAELLPLPDSPSAFDKLSPREAEVVNLLAHGYSRQQTAHHCNLSIHTVSDYAKSGYRKLGIRNRAQAAALVHGAGGEAAPKKG